MKSKRIYIYFSKIIKGKLSTKMKMNIVLIIQLFNWGSHFLRLKKLQVMMNLILILWNNIVQENVFKY